MTEESRKMERPVFLAAIAGNASYIRSHTRSISQRTIDGNSVLHLAAMFGHVEFCEVILKSDLLPSLLVEWPRNSRGSTPLHCAAAAGHSHIVKLLIENEHGSRLLLLRNNAGDTALHEATRNGHHPVVELLVSADAQLAAINNNWGISALYMASEMASVRSVEKLLESQVASHDGPRGQSALHAAVLRSYDITKMIIHNKPIFVRHKDDTQSTPLHFAATTGNVKMVKLLMDSDATVVYEQDKDGLTPLHVAAGEGYVEVIKEMLILCPDAREQRNGKGRNLLHLAVEKKKIQVVKYALESPLLVELVNEPDDEGNTPLHLAVISLNIEISHALISHRGTNINLMNNNGCKPLDLASSNKKSIMGLRMYNIMVDLTLRGSRPSPQRYDHIAATHKEIRNQEEEINRYRALCNNLAIIAVLVATVTFAAGFTLPGGYNSNDQGSSQTGMATLAKRAAFQVFILSDTLAMASSITVTSLLIYSASIDHDVRLHSLRIAMKLMEFAVCALLVAFAAGIYVTVARECLWVSILVCIIVTGVPFSKYVISYCTSANYTSMRTVIQNLMPAKGLNCFGSIDNVVVPLGDEEKTNVGNASMEVVLAESSILDTQVEKLLFDQMPQDMRFPSPPNSQLWKPLDSQLWKESEQESADDARNVSASFVYWTAPSPPSSIFN